MDSSRDRFSIQYFVANLRSLQRVFVTDYSGIVNFLLLSFYPLRLNLDHFLFLPIKDTPILRDIVFISTNAHHARFRFLFYFILFYNGRARVPNKIFFLP